MQRTGSANPFDRLSTLLDGVVDGVFDAKPALADLDKDGTLVDFCRTWLPAGCGGSTPAASSSEKEGASEKQSS